MNSTYISITDFCTHEQIEIDFLQLLSEEGLIAIEQSKEVHYIQEDHIPHIKMCCRLYYELGINVQGIDTIRHLLDRVNQLQDRIQELEGTVVRLEGQ